VSVDRFIVMARLQKFERRGRRRAQQGDNQHQVMWGFVSFGGIRRFLLKIFIHQISL